MQDYLLQLDNNESVNEITLNQNDIYRDLRVRGYDYSGDFVRIKQIRTNDFKTLMGECEWDGNMVTLLDSLLQSQMLVIPYRKLMVPIMIGRISIDPNVLFDELRKNKQTNIYDDSSNNINNNNDNNHENNIQMSNDINQQHSYSIIDNDNLYDFKRSRFCLFKSLFMFYFDVKKSIIIGPGIEIEKLICSYINRRMDSNLLNEIYQWLPNYDHDAIEEGEKSLMANYINVRIVVF